MSAGALDALIVLCACLAMFPACWLVDTVLGGRHER